MSLQQPYGNLVKAFAFTNCLLSAAKCNEVLKPQYNTQATWQYKRSNKICKNSKSEVDFCQQLNEDLLVASKKSRSFIEDQATVWYQKQRQSQALLKKTDLPEDLTPYDVYNHRYQPSQYLDLKTPIRLVKPIENIPQPKYISPEFQELLRQNDLRVRQENLINLLPKEYTSRRLYRRKPKERVVEQPDRSKEKKLLCCKKSLLCCCFGGFRKRSVSENNISDYYQPKTRNIEEERNKIITKSSSQINKSPQNQNVRVLLSKTETRIKEIQSAIKKPQFYSVQEVERALHRMEHSELNSQATKPSTSKLTDYTSYPSLVSIFTQKSEKEYGKTEYFSESKSSFEHKKYARKRATSLDISNSEKHSFELKLRQTKTPNDSFEHNLLSPKLSISRNRQSGGESKEPKSNTNSVKSKNKSHTSLMEIWCKKKHSGKKESLKQPINKDVAVYACIPTPDYILGQPHPIKQSCVYRSSRSNLFIDCGYNPQKKRKSICQSKCLRNLFKKRPSKSKSQVSFGKSIRSKASRQVLTKSKKHPKRRPSKSKSSLRDSKTSIASKTSSSKSKPQENPRSSQSSKALDKNCSKTEAKESRSRSLTSKTSKKSLTESKSKGSVRRTCYCCRRGKGPSISKSKESFRSSPTLKKSNKTPSKSKNKENLRSSQNSKALKRVPSKSKSRNSLRSSASAKSSERNSSKSKSKETLKDSQGSKALKKYPKTSSKEGIMHSDSSKALKNRASKTKSKEILSSSPKAKPSKRSTSNSKSKETLRNSQSSKTLKSIPAKSKSNENLRSSPYTKTVKKSTAKSKSKESLMGSKCFKVLRPSKTKSKDSLPRTKKRPAKSKSKASLKSSSRSKESIESSQSHKTSGKNAAMSKTSPSTSKKHKSSYVFCGNFCGRKKDVKCRLPPRPPGALKYIVPSNLSPMHAMCYKESNYWLGLTPTYPKRYQEIAKRQKLQRDVTAKHRTQLWGNNCPQPQPTTEFCRPKSEVKVINSKHMKCFSDTTSCVETDGGHVVVKESDKNRRRKNDDIEKSRTRSDKK